jgi:HlyD family secretion protein
LEIKKNLELVEDNQYIIESDGTQPITGNPIELRNEEINAILGRVPGRLIRNGITVIFGAMLLIFAGTVFFSYPDVIHCRIVITSSNPPIHLMAQTSGRIHQLLVTDHQKVESGQLLAVLENPADTKDMLLLETLLDSIKRNDIIATFSRRYQNFKLGDVTPYYLEFRKALTEYNTFETLRYLPQKIEATEYQYELLQKYQLRLKEQLDLLEEDMIVEQRDFGRDTTLYRIHAITSSEMDQSYSQLLQKKHSLIGAKIILENVQVQLNQLRITCLDLQTEYNQQKSQLIDNISRTLDGLTNQLTSWKNNYTFRSPHNGIVSFAKIWASNQFISADEPIMSILPVHEEKIIGKMEIPVAGSGKIKQGQKVIIKLDNFPYMEFGVVKGIITSVSLVPIKEFYIAEVSLPDGLRSNYGDLIPFNQEMGGTADIIIEDMSLFERFLQPVRSAIKRK